MIPPHYNQGSRELPQFASFVEGFDVVAGMLRFEWMEYVVNHPELFLQNESPFRVVLIRKLLATAFAGCLIFLEFAVGALLVIQRAQFCHAPMNGYKHALFVVCTDLFQGCSESFCCFTRPMLRSLMCRAFHPFRRGSGFSGGAGGGRRAQGAAMLHGLCFGNTRPHPFRNRHGGC